MFSSSHIVHPPSVSPPSVSGMSHVAGDGCLALALIFVALGLAGLVNVATDFVVKQRKAGDQSLLSKAETEITRDTAILGRQLHGAISMVVGPAWKHTLMGGTEAITKLVIGVNGTALMLTSSMLGAETGTIHGGEEIPTVGSCCVKTFVAAYGFLF